MAGIKTSLRITIPRGLKDSVAKEIESVIGDTKLLEQVGEIARKDTVTNVLKAIEPSSGNQFAAPLITDQWRERKRQLSKVNSPIDGAAGGGSSKARLAFTGQFLASIKATIGRVRGVRTILVGPQGDREPYKNLDGSPSSSTPTNEELGAYLIEQGRDWTGVSRQTIRAMVQLVRAELRRKLR